MQLIVNGDNILGIHRNDQNVLNKYPDGSKSIFIKDGYPLTTPKGKPIHWRDLWIKYGDKKRIIDGNKISIRTIDEINKAETLEELKLALLDILVGRSK